MAHSSHSHFMRRALELALQGKGKTSPNPMVGAVIVRNDKIVSEGFHKKAGRDHAEIIALKKLKRGRAKGTTLYVTMEPCSIHGKTPPCVPAIVKAGIKKVVIGVRDPNPKVDGKGIRWLKKCGVEVIEGVLEKECSQINRPFQKWITTGLPYVTLKAAISLDGKIATSTKESKWISNELSRKYVHELRSEVDAILIGSGTFKADDPQLTVRYGKSKNGKQPMVVIVGSRVKTNQKAKILRAKNREVLFASNGGGRVPLKPLLKKLAKQNVTHVLVEGGGQIFSSFIRECLVDRIITCIAPKLLGGKALDWLPTLSVKKIKGAHQLKNISLRQMGDNVVVEGELKK